MKRRSVPLVASSSFVSRCRLRLCARLASGECRLASTVTYTPVSLWHSIDTTLLCAHQHDPPSHSLPRDRRVAADPSLTLVHATDLRRRPRCSACCLLSSHRCVGRRMRIGCCRMSESPLHSSPSSSGVALNDCWWSGRSFQNRAICSVAPAMSASFAHVASCMGFSCHCTKYCRVNRCCTRRRRVANIVITSSLKSVLLSPCCSWVGDVRCNPRWPAIECLKQADMEHVMDRPRTWEL